MIAISSQRRQFLLALLLALLAIAVRIPHLGWGLPDIDEEALPLKKALDMWGWSQGHLRWDPETAGWPSLSFYIHLGLQHLQYAVGRVLGIYGNRYDFLVENALDRGAVLVWARSLGVLCAAGIVFVGAWLGGRLSGFWGALLAGGSLALSPMLIRHAQLVTPDILLSLFSALALWKVMDLYRWGRARDYLWAGIFLGLGIATKYTPVLFTLGLVAVHLLRSKEETGAWRLRALGDRRLWLAAGACVAAFLLTSPYTLSDLVVLKRDFSYQALHMRQGHFGQEHSAPGIVYYPLEVLGPGLGWPAFGFGIVGLVWCAVRLGGAWRALLVYCLPFLVGILALSTKFERYMLPMLLPLALGLAAWPALMGELPRLASSRGRTALGALLLILCLVPAGMGAAAYHREKGRSSTLQDAREWMTEVLLPRDPALAMESYTPRVPGDAKEALRREPFFARLSSEQQRRLLSREGFRFERIPMNSVRMELIEYYYELRHYLPFDYIVTSSSVRGRYEASPERYPRQMAFYADLDRYCELEREFTPERGGRGPRIRFYHFSEEGKQRLLADRGPLPDDYYLAFRDKLHAPQFFSFVSGVAKRAEEAERWDQVAHYTDVLLETAGRGSLPPQEKLALLERSAHAHLRAGHYAKGLERTELILASRPPDPRLLGYRAQALEGLERLEDARKAFAQCAELARERPGQETWAEWAEKGLARVEQKLSGPGTRP